MKTIYIILAVTTLGLFSCEKIFMKPNAKTDDLSIFNEYAKLVKEKYAMLDFKGVDIDKISDSIRGTISGELADTSLLKKLTFITAKLRDGHSNLIAFGAAGNYGYAFNTYTGYASALSKPILESVYYPNLTKVENTTAGASNKYRFVYGRMASDNDIAYFRIPSFSVQISDSELETIFQSFSGAKGLIFDVRGNGGGDPSLATKIASYFMTETTYTGFERFKVGPGANQFVDSPSNIKPTSSSNKFLEDVVVLTDRGVYSATTTLCYSLDPLSKVKFMGQRTGGGSGSVADGFLANGWAWSLSTSEFIDFEGKHLDDGIDPNIQVSLDENDTTKDEIIEAAILELQ